MCTTCGGNSHVDFGTYKAVCRVCELIDKDTTEKGCALCQVCGQYICGKCWYNAPRRTMATAMNASEACVEIIRTLATQIVNTFKK